MLILLERKNNLKFDLLLFSSIGCVTLDCWKWEEDGKVKTTKNIQNARKKS